MPFTTLAQEMDLFQGAAPIADGGSFSFGTRAAGSSTDVVFTIANSGGADLNLSGTPAVTITGADAGLFSVQAQPHYAGCSVRQHYLYHQVFTHHSRS